MPVAYLQFIFFPDHWQSLIDWAHAVQIEELIQIVTSTDVHCIKRYSRCFAYGVGVVGGVTNYALLISKVFPVPARVIRGGGWREEGTQPRSPFCYKCSIYPSRNRARVLLLRIHGTRDTFQGAGHPTPHLPLRRARQGVLSILSLLHLPSHVGHRAEKSFEHMALCHPVNLRFTHATDGRGGRK